MRPETSSATQGVVSLLCLLGACLFSAGCGRIGYAASGAAMDAAPSDASAPMDAPSMDVAVEDAAELPDVPDIDAGCQPLPNELCNGTDDDCDMDVDEGCPCAPARQVLFPGTFATNARVAWMGSRYLVTWVGPGTVGLRLNTITFDRLGRPERLASDVANLAVPIRLGGGALAVTAEGAVFAYAAGASGSTTVRAIRMKADGTADSPADVAAPPNNVADYVAAIGADTGADVVWLANATGITRRQILWAHLEADGTWVPAAAPLVNRESFSTELTFASVVRFGSGLAIAWLDTAFSGVTYRVGRFDEEGVMIGTPTMSPPASGIHGDIELVSLGDELISMEARRPTTESQLVLRRFTADLAPIGGPALLFTPIPDRDIGALSAAASPTEIGVAFTSRPASDMVSDVWFGAVTADGTTLRDAATRSVAADEGVDLVWTGEAYGLVYTEPTETSTRAVIFERICP